MKISSWPGLPFLPGWMKPFFPRNGTAASNGSVNRCSENTIKTSDAGELFFERLNAIGPHQRDVREVYYLCLSLGFTGQYCNPGDDFMLEQLRLSNLKLLTGSSMGVPSLDKESLFPDAYPTGENQDVALPPAASVVVIYHHLRSGAGCTVWSALRDLLFYSWQYRR